MHDLPGVAGGLIESPIVLRDLAYAVDAEADGDASDEQLALLDRNRPAWRATLHGLLQEAESGLASVRNLSGPERSQILADFERERHRVAAALYRLDGVPFVTLVPAETGQGGDGRSDVRLDAPGEVRLQASWSDGSVVVWAGGPGTPAAAASDELPTRLRALAAPAEGWRDHPPIVVPSVEPAPALSIAMTDALGWLFSVGVQARGETVGASLVWLGRVVVWAAGFVARGQIAPNLEVLASRRPTPAGTSIYSLRWSPALADLGELDSLSSVMPAPVAAVERLDARDLTLAVAGAVVDAIATDAARRLDRTARPPVIRTAADVAETVLTSLDGTPFTASARLASAAADRLGRWAQPVRSPVSAHLVVQLDPPDRGGAWRLCVLGPGHDGRLVPLEIALVDGRSKRHLADEILRLERLLPVLNRPGGHRRGEVILSQDEAFELMAVTGPSLASAGFDVRVPALSRRRARPSLRLTTEPLDASVVGAHQLANVSWSAMFDDVELSADDIRRLAAEARPLIHSGGRWVELDHVDLKETAAALAERAGRSQLSGAEVLRHAMGLEYSPLAGATSVGGHGWASDLIARTANFAAEATAAPEGFVGTLRSYQTEALSWMAFLDSGGLGGCLALDMGLGKTPSVLAHIARTARRGPTLVVAPTAVVGNWVAEARRFTPGLAVVVHHGSSRASAEEVAAQVSGTDIFITTYGTAVRDVDALASCQWARVVLDEAQAIKNPTSDVAQQLRRIPAASRIALTGTPVENGLGDLWAILDFTNPGLVGERNAFVAQLGNHGPADAKRGEKALRTLNGILLFRRTKAEPEVAAELPDKIDELDHCTMTTEQIGLYQAVLDRLVGAGQDQRATGDILAAITALKQICNHPAAYHDDGRPLAGRSGKLARLEEIVDSVFAAGEKVLIFTHFAEWGKHLATHLSERTSLPVGCYHGGLSRGARDRLVSEFQELEGPGALVLSLKAGGTGLNLTAASHVVLYDRWWNPAVEDQARDRAWRLGQQRTVVSHRLVCPGTVDERVEDVVAGKRHIAELVLPTSSSLADLDPAQLGMALGLRPDSLLTDTDEASSPDQEAA